MYVSSHSGRCFWVLLCLRVVGAAYRIDSHSNLCGWLVQLWFDRHGHFHILYHIYTLAHDYKIERCSGHAWSRDGIEWNYSQEHQPFNCVYTR